MHSRRTDSNQALLLRIARRAGRIALAFALAGACGTGAGAGPGGAVPGPVAAPVNVPRAPGAPAGSPSPAVASVMPAQLEQGKAVTLEIRGSNLRAVQKFDLGEGISVQSVAFEGGTSARLAVQVAPNATPGTRPVVLHLASSPAAQPITSAVTIHVVASALGAPVVLSRVTPATVSQGQSVVLTLHGQNFQSGMTASFGPGISATGTLTLGAPGVATVPIQVSALAPTMLRHPSLLLGSGQPAAVSSDASLVVTAASAPAQTLQAVALAAAPVVLSVEPARLFTGQSYTLTLHGQGFVPAMQVALGGGIEGTQSLKLQSARLATISIKVLDGAGAGLRWVQLNAVAPAATANKGPAATANAPAPAGVRQPASFLVQTAVLAVSAGGTAPVLGKHAVLAPAQEGKIILDSPLAGIGSAGCTESGCPFVIPTLNEKTQLAWHEANPGLAQRYEVQFFAYHPGNAAAQPKPAAHAGGPVKLLAAGALGRQQPQAIATRSIGAPQGRALPHFLQPDVALQAQLEQYIQQHGGNDASGGGWEIAWRVVGYRSYGQDGVAPGSQSKAATQIVAGGALRQVPSAAATQEVEVERSTVIPGTAPASGDPLLQVANAPTGMDCASLGNHQSMTVFNNTKAKEKGSPTRSADYVGDVFQLHGTFNLGNSPWDWSDHAQLSQDPLPKGTTPAKIMVSAGGHDLHETLGNVFIDWGDGTVTPMSISWPGQVTTDLGGNPVYQFASMSETASASKFDLGLADNALTHAYGQVGPYTVRVYELPSGQIQQSGALKVSLGAGGGGLFGQVMRSEVGGFANGAGNGGSKAYMFLCTPITISHRNDNVSIGPLQIESIAIEGFPGDASSAAVGSDKLGSQRLTAGATGHAAKTMAPVAKGGAAPASNTKAVDRVAGAAALGGAAGLGGGAALPQFSSCDLDLLGGAKLGYYGTGVARLQWFDDNVPIGSTIEPVPSSPARTDQQLGQAQPPAPIEGYLANLHSPPIDLTRIAKGKHELSVVATVEPVQDGVVSAIRALRTFAMNTKAPGASEAFGGAGLHNAPPLGLLGPTGSATAGVAPIAWLGQIPAGAPGTGLKLLGSDPAAMPHVREPHAAPARPPHGASSAPAGFAVGAADPALPCTFTFPVDSGSFTIAGLQKSGKPTVQVQGGKATGTGTLMFHLTDPTGTATMTEEVPVHINGWALQADQSTVASGSFDEKPGLGPLVFPGISAQLDEISGTVGKPVQATFSASVSNSDIYDANGTHPKWQGVKAPLTPKGDWYAPNLAVAKLQIYDSGFFLDAGTVALDLSETEGAGPGNSCGGAGRSWVGLRFSDSAAMSAYLFDLGVPPTTKAPGWILDAYGFCGQAGFSGGSVPVGKGTLAWGGIGAVAGNGSFTATYKNLDVLVPWLNTHLKSAASTLVAGRNSAQGGYSLNLSSATPVTLNEGPISQSASNLRFAAVAGHGWAVKSDTRFTFTAMQSQLARISLSGFDYAMDGGAFFDDGTAGRHLSLAGQSGKVAATRLDLKSVDVTLSNAPQTPPVTFAFDASLTLSSSGAFSPVDVPVSYAINQSSPGQYAGSGPGFAPFTATARMPMQNATSTIKVHPGFQAGSGGGHAGASGGSCSSGSSVASSQVIFNGPVDVGMFSSDLPGSGQFVLGTYSTGQGASDDYWLAKMVVDLGPGVPILEPPVLSLFQLGGGMGYHVCADSFKNADLSNAVPASDGTLVFDATLQLGTTDHTSVGLQGNFSIKPGGADAGGRLDFQAWILTPNWSGNGDFQGFFSVSGGPNIDGGLHGGKDFLGVYKISAPQVNGVDSVSMHVGSGIWYFNFGTPQMPLSASTAWGIASAGGWLDINQLGLGFGLTGQADLRAGDCGALCVYINQNFTLAGTFTVAPLGVSLNSGENLSIGGCAGGQCLNYTQSVSMIFSAPPPYLQFNAQLGFCPGFQLNLGLQILPSPSPSGGGQLCGPSISL